MRRLKLDLLMRVSPANLRHMVHIATSVLSVLLGSSYRKLLRRQNGSSCLLCVASVRCTTVPGLGGGCRQDSRIV